MTKTTYMFQKTTKLIQICKYILLFTVISLGGWIFETIYCYFEAGRYCDRGFINLPFCPIYGSTILAVYFLLGTPAEGGLLLSRISNKPLRRTLFFLLAGAIPSAAELITGVFFLNIFGIRLWDYSSHKFNIDGHACLLFFFIWGVLITLFMRYLFPPLKRLVQKTPDNTAIISSVIIGIIIFSDFILCCLLITIPANGL